MVRPETLLKPVRLAFCRQRRAQIPIFIVGVGKITTATPISVRRDEDPKLVPIWARRTEVLLSRNWTAAYQSGIRACPTTNQRISQPPICVNRAVITDLCCRCGNNAGLGREIVSRYPTALFDKTRRIAFFLQSYPGFWCNGCIVGVLGQGTRRSTADLTRRLAGNRKYYTRECVSCSSCDTVSKCIRVVA